MRLSWIEYKGKKIFFEDFSNLSGDDFLNLIDEVEKEYEKINEPTLILIDSRNSVFDSTALEASRRLKKKYGHIEKKLAVVGISGIKKIFASALDKLSKTESKYFDTLEEAKEYLSQD